MERTSQMQKVLNHLKKYKELTSWDAFMLYRITRLSAIIFNLRKLGYKIDSVLEYNKTNDGFNTHYSRYILKEKE